MRSCTLNPDKFLMPVDVRQKAFSQLSFSIFEWKRKTKQKWMTSGSWEIINKTSKKLGIQWAIAGVKSRIINASMKQNVSMCVNNIRAKWIHWKEMSLFVGNEFHMISTPRAGGTSLSYIGYWIYRVCRCKGHFSLIELRSTRSSEWSRAMTASKIPERSD